jgi:hypothetical protein
MSAAVNISPDGGFARRGMTWLRAHGPGFILEAAVNFALPLLIYSALHGRWGDAHALLAASAPPIVWSIVLFLRAGRVDALSLLVLAGIALSLLAFLGGGSARLLALREKFVTLAIGMAFLISAAIGKPLIYPLARATMARRSAAEAEAFDARRDHAAVRRTIMVMTLVWGFGLVAEFCLGAALLFVLPIGQYLAVSPVLGYGTIGGLVLWTAVYRRRRERGREG